MWTRTAYDVKCPRSDCEHFKTDARQNPCLGCTCNQWVGDTKNKTFRYVPTRMPEIKEVKQNERA